MPLIAKLVMGVGERITPNKAFRGPQGSSMMKIRKAFQTWQGRGVTNAKDERKGKVHKESQECYSQT